MFAEKFPPHSGWNPSWCLREVRWPHWEHPWVGMGQKVPHSLLFSLVLHRNLCVLGAIASAVQEFFRGSLKIVISFLSYKEIMYTVSKGPSKLVAKTRRGIPQNYEKFETHRDMYRKANEPDSSEIISVPKPIFQSTKKFTNHMKNGHQEETLSPQHEEIVKYIHETWNMVIAQNPYDPPSSPESTTSSPSSSSASSTPTTASPSIYYTDTPSPVLRDFKPFDLESWWGRRLYYNITKSL